MKKMQFHEIVGQKFLLKINFLYTFKELHYSRDKIRDYHSVPLLQGSVVFREERENRDDKNDDVLGRALLTGWVFPAEPQMAVQMKPSFPIIIITLECCGGFFVSFGKIRSLLHGT